MTSHVYEARLVGPGARINAGSVNSVPMLLRLTFLLFVFTVPIESLNLTLDLGPVSVARVAGLLLFAVSFLHYQKCYFALPPALWWFFGYILFFVVTGTFIAPEYTEPEYRAFFVTRLLTLIQVVVFFWIASNLLRNEKFSRTVLLTYALSTVFLCLAVTLGLPGFTRTTRFTLAGDRFSALGANANYMGLVLALASVTLTGLALDKKRRREYLIVPVVLLLGMMVQTGSRSSMLALGAGMFCYLLPLATNRRKAVAVVLAGCVLVVLGYLVLTSETALLRWLATINEGDSAHRDEIAADSLDMISKRPLMGWGPVAAQVELQKRYTGGYTALTEDLGDSHNLALSVLVEGGLVGGTIFLTGVTLCGIAAWKRRGSALGILPFALMMALAVDLQFGTFMTTKPLWLILAVCAGARGFATFPSESRADANLFSARSVRQPKSLRPSNRFH